MRRSYVVTMRWMVIYEYEVPGGALNLSFTKLPKPWSPWGSSPSRKNPHGRTGNRTRDLMISSQKLWLLDHEAGLSFQLYSCVSVAVSTIIRDNAQDQKTLLFKGVCIVTHTALYFAFPFSTELFISHFPHVSSVHTQWNRNFVRLLTGYELRDF
jgi:hypothetical protein